jgi:hypothetical protein
LISQYSPPLLSKERDGVRFIIKIINLSPTLPFVRGEGKCREIVSFLYFHYTAGKKKGQKKTAH